MRRQLTSMRSKMISASLNYSSIGKRSRCDRNGNYIFEDFEFIEYQVFSYNAPNRISHCTFLYSKYEEGFGTDANLSHKLSVLVFVCLMLL